MSIVAVQYLYRLWFMYSFACGWRRQENIGTFPVVRGASRASMLGSNFFTSTVYSYNVVQVGSNISRLEHLNDMTTFAGLALSFPSHVHEGLKF
jgi:hypothetical protein